MAAKFCVTERGSSNNYCVYRLGEPAAGFGLFSARSTVLLQVHVLCAIHALYSPAGENSSGRRGEMDDERWTH
jgi:hypothetical protein